MYILIWLIIPYMAWLSRMHGGGAPKLPLGLDAWLLAAPYFLLYSVLGWWVLVGYGFAVLGIRLGHGRGFNYKLPFENNSTSEAVEVLIPDRLPVPIQKFLIMLLTLAVTLGISCLLSIQGLYIPAVVLTLSGAAKALAYLAPRTEISEYLRGLALGIGLVAALLII